MNNKEAPLSETSLPVSIVDDTHGKILGLFGAKEKQSTPRAIGSWQVVFGKAARDKVESVRSRHISLSYSPTNSIALLSNINQYYWSKVEIAFAVHCCDCESAIDLAIKREWGDGGEAMATLQCPSCNCIHTLIHRYDGIEHIIISLSSTAKKKIRPSALEIKRLSWKAK